MVSRHRHNFGKKGPRTNLIASCLPNPFATAPNSDPPCIRGGPNRYFQMQKELDRVFTSLAQIRI
jgi:hypothetical protein